MFDNIKSKDTGITPEEICNNPYVRIPQLFDEQTGKEIKDKKRSGIDQGLTFTIIPGSDKREPFLQIIGSKHKYSNKGMHNANSFTYPKLLDVAIELWQKYKLNPFKEILCLLEFGANLVLWYEPEKFILNRLLMYNGDSFNITNKPGELFAEVGKTQYYVKVYDKGRQYNMGNILRIELKYTKMEQLNKKGISTFGDLLNLENWQYCKERLLDAFDDLIYYDPSINLLNVEPDESEILKEGYNPIFWQQLKQKDPKNWNKKKIRFLKLVNKYGAYHFGEIRNLIEKEVNNLMGVDSETIRKMTTFLQEVNGENHTQNDHFLSVLNKYNHTQNDHFLNDSEKIGIQEDQITITQNDTLLYCHSPYTSNIVEVEPVKKKWKKPTIILTHYLNEKQVQKVGAESDSPEKSKETPNSKPPKRNDRNPNANDLWLSLFPNITYPTIVDYDGDTSKEWFIYFRVNDAEGRRIKKVWKKGINQFNTEVERRKAIYSQHGRLLERIRSGWNPLA